MTPTPGGEEPAGEPERDEGGGSETRKVRSAVRSVLLGNHDSFGEIVELYEGRLFSLAMMMMREPFAAEEVAQDAFVRAFEHIGRYDVRRPFYPWLATIATRIAHDRLRARSRQLAREEGMAERGSHRPRGEPKSRDVDPLSRLIADEEGRRIWGNVARLPSGERSVVYMYYRDQLRVAEIAKALGVSNGTVKTLLFRARRRLRASTMKGEHDA